jgi:hypothetical protein
LANHASKEVEDQKHEKECVMKGLINFMQSAAGRVLRVVLGIVLVYIGLAVVGGTVGIIVAGVGLLPIVMGIWGPCLLGFVFKPATA